MSSDLSAFVRRAKDLPSLPALYYELVQAIDDPDSSIGEISSLISRDQSLASRLLRLANSALFGLPMQIGTLDEAVQLIGLSEIQNLALVTSMIESFDQVPANLVDVPSFWRHSVACALASSLLAEQRHDPAPERFFVGGLLHDVGRLVMFLNAPAESQEILRRSQAEAQLNSTIETKVMGFDHAMLGAELIGYWRLPYWLVEIVRCHHRPDRAQIVFQDAFTVHYADFITSLLEFGTSGELFVSPLIVPDNCQQCLLEDQRLELFVNELEKKCEVVFPILVRSNDT